jgi:XTP/dITP diphosphohydrolase
MKKIFIATKNIGKQHEILTLAKKRSNDIAIVFPKKNCNIKIEETATTYDENAYAKALAYQKAINDDSMFYIGDDSGMRIPALNNEPGVYSRRWAGYEMTDQEILDYCLEKMKHLKGSDRRAVFETVLIMLDRNGKKRKYTGIMWGHILEKPMKDLPLDGFPFRSTFFVDEVKTTWQLAHEMPDDKRNGFLTNREYAFKNLFFDLSKIN